MQYQTRFQILIDFYNKKEKQHFSWVLYSCSTKIKELVINFEKQVGCNISLQTRIVQNVAFNFIFKNYY